MAAQAQSSEDIGRPSAVTGWEESEVQFACVGSGCLMLQTDDMREAFARYDADADGFVTSAELTSTLLELSDGAVTEEEAVDLFQRVDRDHNGKIDFSEFVQAVTADKV